MATHARITNQRDPRGKSNNLWWVPFIFPTYVTFFLLWPKYAAIGLGRIHVSPYNILTIISIILILTFSAGLIRRESRFSAIGIILITIYILEWANRYLADLMGLDPATSIYLTTRDFIWIGSAFFISSMLSGGRNGLRTSTFIITVCSLIISLITIFEFSSGRYFSGILISSLPIDISSDFQAMLSSDKVRNGAFRAQSVFSHPLVLGEVLAAVFPIAVASALTFRRRQRLISILACVLILAAIPMTGTRSSQVAVLIAASAFCALAILTSRALWLRLAGAGAIALAAFPMAYLILPVVTELQSGRNAAEAQSSMARVQMWSRGGPAIDRSPWLGYGDGSALQIAGIRVGRGLTVDDFYLTQIVDFGFIHIALLALLTLACVGSSMIAPIGRDERRLAVAMAAGMLAIAIGQKATSIPEGTSIFYLFGGMLAGLWRTGDAPGRARYDVPRRSDIATDIAA